MPTVVIPCPHCGAELKLKDRSLIGKKGKCPKCAETFRLEEPDEVDLELVAEPSATTPAAPVSQPVHSEPAQAGVIDAPITAPLAETGGVQRMKELRRKSKKRRNFQILVGGIMACAIAGTLYYFKTVQDQNARDRAAAASTKNPQNDQQYISEKKQLKENMEAFAATSVTQGDPIALNFMPAGAKVVINLYPAEFWKQGTLAEEFRFCLGPLGTWFESTVQELTGFAPSSIDRLMICVMPGLRGDPPDIAALVELVEPQKKFDMIKLFQGERVNDIEPSIYISGKKCYVHVDEKTFAVGPGRYAQEMADAIDFNAVTDEDIQNLLVQTDRDRHLTILFDPKLLRLEQETYFPENARPLLNHFLDWVGDDVRSMAWSMHFDRRFDSEMTFRNDSVVPPSSLQKKMDKRLNEVPYRVLAAVEKMQPTQVGKRKIIGRFPAMLKAFTLATLSGIDIREVQFKTVLHERAAPNLALGSLLAWDESTRTDFNRSDTPATTVAAAEPKKELTLEEKLNQKMEVDFRNTPLQDAFTLIAQDSGISIEVDGDGLKSAGFTQNMTQTVKVENATVRDGIIAILDGSANKIISQNPGVLVLVYNDQTKGFTVSTMKYITDRDQKPYEFKKQE